MRKVLISCQDHPEVEVVLSHIFHMCASRDDSRMCMLRMRYYLADAYMIRARLIELQLRAERKKAKKMRDAALPPVRVRLEPNFGGPRIVHIFARLRD